MAQLMCYLECFSLASGLAKVQSAVKVSRINIFSVYFKDENSLTYSHVFMQYVCACALN